MEKLEIDQMEKIEGGSLNRPGNICGGNAPLTLWGPTPAVAAAVAAANCIKDWWTE